MGSNGEKADYDTQDINAVGHVQKRPAHFALRSRMTARGMFLDPTCESCSPTRRILIGQPTFDE